MSAAYCRVAAPATSLVDMSAATKTRSEEWFEQYLRENGYEGATEHEPDLGGTKRPDYLVEENGAQAIVEVKEFDVSDHEQRKRAALDSGQAYDATAKKALAAGAGARA